MDDLDHHELTEEWKQNLYAVAYGKNINQGVKIPSINRKIDRNEKN